MEDIFNLFQSIGLFISSRKHNKRALERINDAVENTKYDVINITLTRDNTTKTKYLISTDCK